MANSLSGIAFASSTILDTIQVTTSNCQFFGDYMGHVGRDSLPITLRIPRKPVFDSIAPGISVYFIITSIDFGGNKNRGSARLSSSYIPQPYHLFSSLKNGSVVPPLSYFPPPMQEFPHHFHYTTRSNPETTVRYTIWDQQSDRVVSYGVFTASHYFIYSSGSWVNLFEEIAAAFIKNSQFRK